ncbi:MAG: SMI1/KNR4 family protein [Lachnospiraceae bacterium]|nr:SMI1/KNR4 family protein [Lachnospiraceae bacterium]
MWKESLEEIRQGEKRYGGEINCGISEEEVELFIKEVENELNLALPEDYIKILKVVNGIEFNGTILYGVDEPLLKEAPSQHVNGLIDCNKVWYENEWQKQYLFLGEGSISWYVYDLGTKKYYELDNPSGEISEEFDNFEQMLDKMLEDSLM